jgi:hypothetical protein
VTAGTENLRVNASDTMPTPAVRPLLNRCLVGLASGICGLLAGCAAGPELPSATGEAADPHKAALPRAQARIVLTSLPPADRPVLKPGDTFIYGRDQVVRVLAASPGELRWQVGETTARSTPDFFVPAWPDTPADGARRPEITGQPDALWPLQVGKSVSFTDTRSDTTGWGGRPASRSLRWECRVVDARVSQVPAGDYDSFHVECLAYRSGVPLVVQTRTWDYSPALGHTVRQTSQQGARREEQVLSAALPANVATQARVQRALRRLATR